MWSRRPAGNVEPTTRRQCGADDPSAMWSRRLVGNVEPTTRRQCGADDPSAWRDGRRRRDGPVPFPRYRAVATVAVRQLVGVPLLLNSAQKGAGPRSAPDHPAACAHPTTPTSRRLHIARASLRPLPVRHLAREERRRVNDHVLHLLPLPRVGGMHETVTGLDDGRIAELHLRLVLQHQRGCP